MQADLDPAFIDHLVIGIADAIPWDQGSEPTRRAAARLALLALQPADTLEAMTAAQAVAAHYAAMDAFKRAAKSSETDAMAVRLRASAAAMAKLMHATVKVLREGQVAAAEAAAPAVLPVAPIADTASPAPDLEEAVLVHTASRPRAPVLGETTTEGRRPLIGVRPIALVGPAYAATRRGPGAEFIRPGETACGDEPTLG